MQMQSIFTSMFDNSSIQSARMFSVQRLIRLLAFCCVLSFTTQLIRANEPADFKLDERDRAAVATFFEAYKKVRDDDYGNAHFVMAETFEVQDENGHTRTVTEINYWALDNRYFRVDMKTLESSDPKKRVGRRERMVLGPDGWISLIASSATAPLAIHNWGSIEEGQGRLGGYSFFQAAIRGFWLMRADRFFSKLVPDELQNEWLREVARQTQIADFHLSNDGSRMELKSNWKSQPLYSESTMLTDVENGVVLHQELKYFGDDVLSSSSTADKKYDFERWGCIPAHHFEKRAYPDGTWYSRQYETQLVDWKPVPLGIFSLEAQGLRSVAPGSVWSRRLLTLLVGLVLVGIYVAFKRARDRASE